MEGFVRGLDADALKVVQRLLAAGHEAYLVGGCVRDLYLGRRPKDFDVATSATPEAIRRLFRNSRIIGRRFKLAHVFFGPKIIETSTFRTAPQTDESEDLLITHDNEWGTVEDDARRRDFTINGLFYDVETEKIVDFVDGLTDLEARIIRTIGDPVVRFREDPVRMIRAIKFAARLNFEFDPTTWQALLEVAPDIVKCSKARVLEEIYKLLRGGSARRSFDLMLEAGLMQSMMPSYVQLFGDDVESGARALLDASREFADGQATQKRPEVRLHPEESFPGRAPAIRDVDPANQSHLALRLDPDFRRKALEEDEDAEDDRDGDELPPALLLQRFFAALDDYTLHTSQAAANGVLQAVLFAPLLGDDLTSGTRHTLDRRIDDLMAPVGAALGIARRDRDLARQILMAHRRMVEPANRRRRVSMSQRQYFHDALIFLGVAVQATGDDGSELGQWQRLARTKMEVIDDDDDRKGARKRKRGGRRRRGKPDGAPRRSAGAAARAASEG